MPILFKCPHCRKNLKVQERLAGKKAKCPLCKKSVTIPVAEPVPQRSDVDVEALAAAALADAPAAAKAAEPVKAATTIDFTCPFCDEEIKLSAELGGKKEPCPKCKRIVKVPLPQDNRPKDWREVQKPSGPSAAVVKNQQPELEGAWGTETSKGRVSQQALMEADAVVEEEEEEEPVGVLGWIKRGVIAAVAVAAIVFLTTTMLRSRTEKRERDDIQEALKIAEDAKLPPILIAEIHRAAGEFFLRKGKPKQALEEFKKAQARFPRQDPKAKVPIDNDLFLIRLAASEVDLGGDKQEVEKELRLGWKDSDVDLPKEIGRTLNAIRTAEGQVAALRAVADKLLKRDQPTVAIGLAIQIKRPEEGKDDKSPIKAQRVALLLQTNENVAAQMVPPPKPGAAIADLVPRLAYAEGRARKGNFADAMKLVQAPGPARDRLEAALAVGHLALEADNQAEAAACAKLAVDYAKEAKVVIPPWFRLQMVRLLARADSMDKAKELLQTLPPAFKSWAQWEIFQAQLAKESSVAAAILVEDISDKDSLPRALAWEALARHNAPLDRGDVLHILENAPDGRVRAFIHAGMALGSQERLGPQER